ncbi:MAG: DUF1707 domain-containing protein [Gordonia sp. (in: high G+C Gram-positive bacteria)]|uniref:DUF1707 SHOCT-like domain-containing protein n=1 Tax=Gordonia TaxID=2053 RepID=UPI003264F8C0
MTDMEPTDSPSSHPGPGDRPAVRASDADRERTHSYLSAAMTLGVLTPEEYTERAGQAVAARTRADLDVLTADLPLDQLRSTAVEAASGTTQISVSGARPVTKAMAVFGANEVGGGAVVGADLKATAVMGGVGLDLRNVEYTAPVLEIRCKAVMGGIEITVPPDVTVEVHGRGIMGGFDGSAAGPGGAGAPRVVVRGFALMGGVDVRRRARGDDIGPRRAR